MTSTTDAPDRVGPALTAPERETVILMSDADGIARISTHQRRILTKLERNPSARKVKDIAHGSQPGAIFEVPASLVSIRNGKRKLSEAARQASAARLSAVRERR